MLKEQLPYSQACENNKKPILKVLRQYISNQSSLLEIAGGTGQHGEFLAKKFPNLHWQTSDVPAAVGHLNLRISAAKLKNLPLALPLDVNYANWGMNNYELLFTANSLHIMSVKSVENFFTGIPSVLKKQGLVFIYGPFKYEGNYTTESNAQFDDWLRARNPESGIRDFEDINTLAAEVGLNLVVDVGMPANNQILIFSLAE